MLSAAKEPLQVIVVGAGLAGASTAFALARRGHRVRLVEREPRHGAHASGRNAGMIRHVVNHRTLITLASQGAKALASPPPELASQPLYRRTGSLLLARGEDAKAKLEEQAALAREMGVSCRLGRPDRLGLWGLSASPEDLALASESDGVADPMVVLEAYLEGARRLGAEIELSCTVRLLKGPAGVQGVQSDKGVHRADVVVNAAGPWAAELVQDTGGLVLPLRSYRRHVFLSAPQAGVDPNSPWIWDEAEWFYLRPEAGGLLLSPCDEEERLPEDCATSPGGVALLRDKLRRLAPDLAGIELTRSWAGLRTFAPDRRFVVGWDPHLSGLFWVAALGGHGLSASYAVGELAARALQGEGDALLRELDPARFSSTPAASDPL